MPTAASESQLHRRPFDGVFEALFALIVLVASYHHLHLKLFLTENIGFSLSLFKEVAAHTAEKYYQSRFLIPEICSLIARLDLPYISNMERLLKLTELLSLVMLVFAFRKYIELFIKSRKASAMLSFSIFLILPFNIFFPRPYYLFYWFDTPAMLFFTLGLIFLYRRQWLAYYAILALSTLNRETSCFLIAVYFLTSIGKEAPLKVFGQCAAQLALWLSIKLALFVIFMGNPGPTFEIYDGDESTTSHLSDNLAYLVDPWKAMLLLSHMGFLWLFPLAGFRLIRDAFVSRSMLIGLPYFGGMMIVANIYELRIFGELIPVFLMGFILMLRNAINDER